MVRVPAVLLVDQDPQARFELKQLVKQAQLTLARAATPAGADGWHSDRETMRAAMLAGARDFLVMPVEAERLNESILAVLESEEHKRQRLTGQTAKLGPRGLVISLFGAKGGVGKSTVATNMGVALSALMGPAGG